MSSQSSGPGRERIYIPDVDESMKHFDLFGLRLGALGALLPMTLSGSLGWSSMNSCPAPDS